MKCESKNKTFDFIDSQINPRHECVHEWATSPHSRNKNKCLKCGLIEVDNSDWQSTKTY